MRTLVLAIFLARALHADDSSGGEHLDQLRHAAMGDIFVLKDYRPGKNSFVESPDRHIGQWTHQGFRYTLADLQGQGSIRHLWTTRGDGEPYFEWEFYVDGETTPSIRGTDEELIKAAAQYERTVAPANAVPLGNRDFNLFLPIPFDRSCRVDVVQRVPSYWLWFCQLDYRLQDDSMEGVRLFTDRSQGTLRFSYVGLPSERITAPTSSLEQTSHTFPETSIPPATASVVARLSGPAIARQLRLRWSEGAQLRLQVRYDQGKGWAINSPLTNFFGPFRGASFFRHAAEEASCYLPMPFRESCEVVIRNEGSSPASLSGAALVESVPSWSPSWGYLHALFQRTERTTGHRPHQVLYLRGRGHWLGMTLYRTGHDHGGGDFAIVDGEAGLPSFLHGINGEDYFTFAWFGKGEHSPYAVAHSNDEGRYRHHFENVYPFHHSFALEWGAFADLSPESVAVWYQDTPDDTTLPDGARADSAEWDVFGPVPIPHDPKGVSQTRLFDVLPSIKDLDAGRSYECRLVKESFQSGWRKEQSVGPALNLTYLGRHGTKIDYEAELGGMGHAMLARRFLEWPRPETVTFLFSHDDPVELWLNGRRVYHAIESANGFENHRVALKLRRGRNEVVVRLSNYFNRNFNWAGFLLRPDTGSPPK